MKFDIARQPLVPAFLTLAALAVAAMCRVETQEVVTQTRDAAASWAFGGMGLARGLAVPTLATLITRFQVAYPVWAHLLGGYLILFAGMCTGRLSIRYNLYSVGTSLSIPLYAVAACGIATDSRYLAAYTASALLALSIKNFSRAFRNGYGFDGIFRASLYLSLLVLILPAAAPLLLLLPLAVLLFRRTVRETVVALAGLLLPVAALCYVNWGARGTFTAPVEALAEAFMQGSFFQIFRMTPLPELLLGGGVALLSIVALLSFLTNIYAAGTKPRFLLIFNIGVLALTATALCGPSATPAMYALAAVPAALLLPVFFVRTDRAITLAIYLILLAAAFYNTLLQYFI